MIEQKVSIKTTDTHKTEQLAADLARQMLEQARASEGGYFAFVAMYGDLGAGKTAFVRGMASVLAPEAYVRSPTYTLVNEYKGDDFRIAHFDVYRIHDEDDLYSVGFYDYFPSESDEIVRYRQNNLVIAVEWCEKIPFALPDEYYLVKIDKCSPEQPDERLITIEKINKKG